MGIGTKIQDRLHQIHKQQEIRAHHLQYLFLEITKRCNLNCLHCGSDCKKETNSPELTTDSWIKIIDYIKAQFSSNVGFIITGGEPLLHKDLFKIGKHIKENGMRWGMVTNGMLLNELTLKKLIAAGISSITLSVDGTEESHNWLRNNKRAFCKVTNALKHIAESEIKFKDVVTCVSPKNLEELDEIAELLIDFGIKKWRLFRIFPSGRAANNTRLTLDFEQTQQMLNWIELNKPKLNRKGLTINLSCEGWVPFKQDKKLRDTAFFCRSGINIASILADGTITGCSNNSSGFHVGNILTENFKKVWNENFDIFRDKQWLKNTICSNCEHLKKCFGSSIHLWKLGEPKPKFCYAKEI